IGFPPAFPERQAGPKGGALGRPQRRAKPSIQKAQEGRGNNPEDCSFAGNPRRGFPVFYTYLNTRHRKYKVSGVFFM
ncbi:MAG: hypothetical protein K6G71_04150, partial [Clostridiales bacterium]|nr:hypothetical protein [Clostridiales bacterium]